MNIKKIILNSVRALFRNPTLETLFYKYSKGKKPESIIVKFLPPHYIYKKSTFREVERHGLRFLLDLSDLVDWYLYFALDEASHENLYKLCAKKSIVFDVGTNNGAVLLQLGTRATEGFVYGFEPDSVNFQRALKNISLNSLYNIEVVNTALGTQKGEANMLVVDSSNLGMNKISPQVQQQIGRTVCMNSLNEFVKERNISKVDLIKIDTEGFELNVLKGADEVLVNFKPILFIEVNDNNLREQAQSARELISFISNLGYSIKKADTNDTVDENYNFTNCHFDIIAVNEKGT